MTGTLLVTGVSGFIGRQLVPAAAAVGWTVLAASRSAEPVPGSHPVALPDLAQRDIDWAPLLEGVTHVVHLAGLAHMTTRIPEATYTAINAQAAGSLAAAARRAGVHRMVLVSSIRAQSGPVSARVITESDQAYPTDAYGRSKLAGERAVMSALAGSTTDGVVLRPVLVYGPGVKGNMATLFKLARLPLPLPLGSLPGRRSIISIGNLCSAILHVLQSPTAAGGTFLAADPAPVSVPEILTALRRGLGRRPGLFPVPLEPAAVLSRLIGREAVWERVAGSLIADTSRLAATGWTAPEETATALARAIVADLP